MTKDEFKSYLEHQGLWDREIAELLDDYKDELANITEEDFKIVRIINHPSDLAEEYLDELNNSTFAYDLVCSYINYDDFGEYIATDADEFYFLTSSRRIIEWSMD